MKVLSGFCKIILKKSDYKVELTSNKLNLMKRNITFILLIFLFSSCATMKNGPTQLVFFNSNPHGALITIDGKEYGTTPKSIELRRDCGSRDIKDKKSYDVVIDLEGYSPYEIKITREIDGKNWFLGNLLLGGVIGMMIDASTGSMYKLSRQHVIATIDEATANNFSHEKIYFAVTLDPDPSWEKIGQLTRK